MNLRMIKRTFMAVAVMCSTIFVLKISLHADIYHDTQQVESQFQDSHHSDVSDRREASTPPKSIVVDPIESEMKARVEHMRKACANLGLDRTDTDALHRVYPWEYFINKKHRLVWCNIFKSGSSSWMYIFNRLAGYDDKELKKIYKKTPPVTLARKHYKRPTAKELLDALKDSTSFIVGRNPFERLVSGYRDKIVGALRGSYHEKLGRAIILKYRNVDVTKLGRAGRSLRPTFTEFVRHVLDEYADGKELDMHWTPSYSFCNPCQVKFTDIVKFETFNRDQTHIMRKSNISDLVAVHKENSAKDGKKSQELVKDYFQELPNDLFYKLVDLYRIDFLLFDYEIPSPFNKS